MPLIHVERSPHAGQTVLVNFKPKERGETLIRVEDWWDRVAGKSWMNSDGNPAALSYAMRAGFTGIPIDDEVLYGKDGSFGVLFHVSEIKAVAAAVGGSQ